MSDTAAVNTAFSGASTILTLDYPEKRNALSLRMRAELISSLQNAMSDSNCRTIILTGKDGQFCSGGDASSFSGLTPAAGNERMKQMHTLVRLVFNCEKPIIACVEGFAAGAGLGLASACDVIVADPAAKFSCAFNKIGLVPDFGSAWTLPRRMGAGRAKLFILSGATLSADEAHAQGLVEVISSSGNALERAKRIAQEINLRAPISNTFAKAMLNRQASSFERVLDDEADAQTICYGTQDFEEGWRAFLEKRQPDFRNA